LKKIYIILLFLLSIVLYSNNECKAADTLAFIKLYNTILTNPQTLEFEIHIQRNSTTWLKFANGTYQFTFYNPDFKYDKNNLDISMLESELPPATFTGADLPTDGYLIEPKIFDNRISITILGPTNFDDCITVPKDSSILVSKLRVQTKDSRMIPEKLIWLKPIDWYQASAFKLAQDSIVDNVMRYYYSEDNVSMEDDSAKTDDYTDGSNIKQFFEFDNMWVVYTGQLLDSIGFRTKSEYKSVGYTLLRGIRTEFSAFQYTDTIYSYLQGSHFNPEFKSKGYSVNGYTYGGFFDTLQYRGGQYCYALYGTFLGKDAQNYDTLLAERCILIPNAVIVEAAATPNPFTTSTTIEYNLEDDVYLTVVSFDALGKKIKNLTDPESKKEMDKVLVKKGRHTTVFQAPELASQGLYSIVFLAYPVKDPAIEFSRAIVKVQLLRDGSK
jgi:hypothetical protein